MTFAAQRLWSAAPHVIVTAAAQSAAAIALNCLVILILLGFELIWGELLIEDELEFFPIVRRGGNAPTLSH